MSIPMEDPPKDESKPPTSYTTMRYQSSIRFGMGGPSVARKATRVGEGIFSIVQLCI